MVDLIDIAARNETVGVQGASSTVHGISLTHLLGRYPGTRSLKALPPPGDRCSGRSVCGHHAADTRNAEPSADRQPQRASVMWTWLARLLSGPVVTGLVNAYKAKLDAATTRERIAADLAAKETEAEIESPNMIADWAGLIITTYVDRRTIEKVARIVKR